MISRRSEGQSRRRAPLRLFGGLVAHLRRGIDTLSGAFGGFSLRRCGCALVLLALLLPACAPATPELGPAEVVAAFYRWYIGYPGNAVADDAYRASPYLADEMVAAVDTLRAAEPRGGADPFLLAQDIPERFEVGEATVNGLMATAPLQLYWSGNPMPTVRVVQLELLEGEWRIVGVTVGEG
jgi:hypothetical protein